MSVLSLLTEQFPELYEASETRADQDNLGVPGVNDVATDNKTGSQSDVSHAAANDTPDAGQQDPYQQKIESITGRFASRKQSADTLEAYLHEAAAAAKEAEARALTQADAEFTPAWRNVGLPARPSHLALDPSKIAGAGLVNPKAIMGAFQQLRAREELAPPQTYEYNDTSKAPNYLATTTNMQSRKTTILSSAKADRVHTQYLKERIWPHLSSEEVAARIAESEKRRRQQDLRMPASQYDLEKKIIASMHHKLSFLRNPRFPLPPAVKALQEQFQPTATWSVGGGEGAWDGDEEGSPRRPRPKTTPPIKSDMTRKAENVFVAEPEEVMFTDYEVGLCYTHIVRIRNVTQVTRGLRLLPPASQYFHMSMPRFPMHNGAIAPGMAAEVYIRFTPDSLADYDDLFVVDTATSRFSIPLKARRPPPMLTLSPELHCGEVVCGNRLVKQFRFHNLGGRGKFRIIPAELWPAKYSEAPNELATIGPFQVWPLFYDLDTGAEVVLSVAFEPTEIGVHTQTLVLVCDNCQVKEFSIRGLASDVDIQLESVDGQSMSESSHMPSAASVLDMPLWYGGVVPGSGFTRRVAVRNTTTLPFPFQWFMASKPATREEKRLNVPLGVDLDELLLEGSLSGGFAQGLMGFGASSSAMGAAAADVAGLGLAPAVAGSGSAQARARQSTPLTAATLAASGLQGTMVGEGVQGTGHLPSGMGVYPQEAKGQVDLVALGIEPDIGFEITPSEGTLQPGEMAEFCITFLPKASKRYMCWAHLKVDKGLPGHGEGVCDVGVLEVGLEGVGVLLEASLEPRVVKVAGTLTPGEVHHHKVKLTNPTRAPANFTFEGLDEWVGVEPCQGTVAPNTTLYLTATVRVEEVGTLVRGLMCHIQHGPSIPLLVTAKADRPRAELATTRIDFGLVRLAGSAQRSLVIRNTSATCSCPWTVEEVVNQAKGLAATSSRPSTAAGSGVRGSLRDLSQPGAGAWDSTDHHTLNYYPDEPSTTHLSFWPSNGILEPGEECEISVTCHAMSGGQHHSAVKLLSAGGSAVACCEAFAVVVTPQATISRPRVDLGATFVGVMCRFSLDLRNLSLLPLEFHWSAALAAGGLDEEGRPRADVKIRPESGTLEPGEEVEIQVRYTPLCAGPASVLGVCDILGAPLPTGFMVSCITRDLEVSYDLLTPEQYSQWVAMRANPRTRKRRDDVTNFVGMAHLPPEVLAKLGPNSRLGVRPDGAPPLRKRHHVADFGQAVPLGDTRNMYLIITNQSAIPTSLCAWLETFGVEDVGKLPGQLTANKSAATRMTGPPPPMPGGPGVSPSGSLTRPTKPHKYAPIRLADDREKTAPFRAATGNAMMATRHMLQEADRALGSKGLAISAAPPECDLPAWGRAVLCLSVFNDMCGDYFDVLNVKVGPLPDKQIPVRVGVAGTPLAVQRERVLVSGLKARGELWRTRMDFGALPLGVQLSKTFYVFNTGGLDMHLSWSFMRFQDEWDRHKPDAQLLDVAFEPTGAEPRAPGAARHGALSASPSTLRITQSGAHPPGQPSSTGAAGAAGGGGSNPQHPSSGTPEPLHPPTPVLQTSLSTDASGVLASGASQNLLNASQEGLCGEGGQGGVDASDLPWLRLKLAPHAEKDGGPFVVEPTEAVIHGGESARFTLCFVSDRAAPHAGYLHGVQRVFSPQAPLALKVWPSGDWGDGVGVMMSGVFHPYAGLPPTPLQPLRVDVEASSVRSHLEPDSRAELSWVCTSTTHPTSPAYKHTLTLTNLQACPLIFKLDTRGPFKLLSAVPSAPQDPVAFRGTTGLSTTSKLPSGCCGAPDDADGAPSSTSAASASVTWPPGHTYLPPGESVDVTIQFQPTKEEHRDDFNLSGELVVTYANGDVQVLPLAGHIMHPALEVRHTQQLVQRPSSAEARTDPASASAATAGGRAGARGPPRQSAVGTAAPSTAGALGPTPATARASTPGTSDPKRPLSAGQALGLNVAVSGAGVAPGTPPLQTTQLAATTTSMFQDEGKVSMPRPAPGTVLFPAAKGAPPPAQTPNQVWTAAPAVERRLDMPMDFGLVHPQAPKALEVTLLNPTLVDALWSATTTDGAAKYCKPEEAHTMGVTQSEATFGPFTVKPAHGLLPGRGLKLPRTQRLTVTFKPPDHRQYRQTVVFGVSKGRPVTLELVGTGSYSEAEEHQRQLYQL